MANTPIQGETERVVLGACDIYVGPYDGGSALDLDAFTADPDNYFGNTQGGTTVEYTPETYTVEDDKGRVKQNFMTKAAATIKTGLLTYTVESLSRILSVGTLTTPSAGKKRLQLPGGKAKLRRMAVVAVYTDDEGGTIKVGIVATNTGALSMAFAKDKETTPEITFTAEPTGGSDVLVTIEENEGGGSVPGITVYSVEGSTGGKTKIVVTPQKGTGQSYKYKTDDAITLPGEGDVLDDGWTDWDGSAEITAADGDDIVIAIVTTADNKCVRAGKTTVVAA